MNRFFTSDFHIGHRNILGFCPESRPFSNIEEMEEAIVENWNSVVRKQDIVYNLGDIFFHKDIKKAEQFISKLNGKHYLILGNHDQLILKNLYFKFDFIRNDFYLRIDKKIKFHLYHYPILHWRNKDHGSFHLYGHLHSNKENRMFKYGKAMDVGLDGNNCQLYSLDEILELLKNHNPGNIKHH